MITFFTPMPSPQPLLDDARRAPQGLVADNLRARGCFAKILASDQPTPDQSRDDSPASARRLASLLLTKPTTAAISAPRATFCLDPARGNVERLRERQAAAFERGGRRPPRRGV